MNDVVLEFAGIHDMEPENDLCAVFRWVEGEKILPIWLSPVDGARALSHTGGFSSSRPDTYDLLIDVLEEHGGIDSIRISSHFEGTFMVDVSTTDGANYDCRPSDAIVLSEHFGIAFSVDEDILAQTAVYVSADDLQEYFGLTFVDSPGEEREVSAQGSGLETSASGNPQADADFEEMMRSLGVSEEDFLSGHDDEENNDTRVINDDNDDGEV